MKLLTSAGFLYSQAIAEAGNSGSWQDLDYVARFPEGANLKYLAKQTSVYQINVGWAPMVTATYVAKDGGKVITGFGKVSGTVLQGWVMKMWGAYGASGTLCGVSPNTIVGYVTMIPGLAGDKANNAACTLSANANVQWAWTNQAVGGNAASMYSSVYLAIGEDIKGTGTANTSVTTLLWAVGGKNTWKAYGMGPYMVMITKLSIEGVVVAFSTALTVVNNANGLHQANEFLVSGTSSVDALWKVSGGQSATNACYTAASTMQLQAAEALVSVGGTIGNVYNCPAIAADGYVLGGINIFYKLGASAVVTIHGTAGSEAPVETTNSIGLAMISAKGLSTGPFQINSLSLGTAGSIYQGWNIGTCTMIRSTKNATAAAYEIYWLVTSNQDYTNSAVISTNGLVAANSNATGNVKVASFDRALYGSVHSFTHEEKANAASVVWSTTAPDHFVFCGTWKGSGMCAHWSATAGTSPVPDSVNAVDVTTADSFATGTNAALGVLTIKQPDGGVGQFRGAKTGAAEIKYVETICNGVATLIFTGTYPQKLNTDVDSGFVLSCYTGVSQCNTDVSKYSTTTFNGILTLAEHSACLLDPRYMTWRAMTVKIDYKASTADWWRVDSYYNEASTSFASTWGPGIVLGSHEYTGLDNFNKTGATVYQKTFVFAYGDGSGVQLNHLSFGVAVPTDNKNKGTPGNALVTQPATFTNAHPNRVDDNLCLTSHLNLEGTTDTSGLGDTITAWSDGYKGTTTLELDYILPGALGGWRGVCIVYYSSQYVQDDTNGAVCHLAAVSTTTADGPTDFGASTLQHVQSTDWQPPALSAGVSPSTGALSGGKYSLTIAPSARVQRSYTDGYYTTATWYQPKYASSYTGIARYGKDDYVGVYCVQGRSSTSWFQAPATASVKLSAAVSLAAGIIALGSAVIAI